MSFPRPHADPHLTPEHLRSVAGHHARFGTPAIAAIARSYLSAHPPPTGSDGLSEREEDVLRLIALGYSNKEIAAQLKVSVKTVETYKARAMEKLGLLSRVELVQYTALRGWFADLGPPRRHAPRPAGEGMPG